MLDYRIFQNSYLVAIIAFILLTIFFYLFGIGFKTVNGKKVFTYRYQIGIALLVWLFWKFYLYPSPNYAEPKTGGLSGMNVRMWR